MEHQYCNYETVIYNMKQGMKHSYLSDLNTEYFTTKINIFENQSNIKWLDIISFIYKTHEINNNILNLTGEVCNKLEFKLKSLVLFPYP